jgi:hypothetical protein
VLYSRLTVAVLAALACSRAGAAVTYLGVATLDGLDKSGLSGKLEDGVRSPAVIGGFSAIAWTGRGNSYLVLPDRGPNAEAYAGGEGVDNTQSFINRVQAIDIEVTGDASHGWSVAGRLTGTTLLSSEVPLTGATTGNPERRYFTGLSSGIDPTVPTRSMRLDSEGLRVASDRKSFFVSDEYGPFVYEFAMSTGQRLRSFVLPSEFVVQKAAAIGKQEIATNTTGRVSNKGMEGLAITPDGGTLVGLMQAPLLQDHALSAEDGKSAVGIYSRLISIDLRHCSAGTQASCATRQFVYEQSAPTTGNSELLAVNEHQFLAIERDGKAGDGSVKLITLIDLDGATDISAVAQLPQTGLPAAVKPTHKRVLFDLAATLKAAGETVVEKYEGLAFGPDLPDGRHLLLVSVDNDFVRDAPSKIYAFAVDRNELPEFKQQVFSNAK